LNPHWYGNKVGHDEYEWQD